MQPTLEDRNILLIEKISLRFGKLQRGDIVTVNVPEFLDQGRETIIKRIIALENDTVEIKEGRVFVNGKELEENYIVGSMTRSMDSRYDNVTVPKGHIYILGDNRNNSMDSRMRGPIDIKKVSGKVLVRIFPLDEAGKI